MVIASTPRLLLREFRPDDLPSLSAILYHPEVMRFSVSGPMSRQQVRWMLARIERSYAENRFGLWAVEHRVGLMIGYCGLWAQEVDGRPEVELGYRLARNYWGGGLATEAARATRDHAFSSLGLPRLISLISPENIGSIRVAEKTGLRFEKETVKWDLPVRVYALAKPDAPERTTITTL